MAESDFIPASIKICARCEGLIFYKSGKCVACVKAYKVKWSAEKADHILAYREKNKERDRLMEAKHRRENPEKIAAAKAKFMAENLDRFKAQQKAYYDRNAELCKQRARDSFERNRERCKEMVAEWCKRNPEKMKASHARRNATLIATPLGRMKYLMRARIGRIFKMHGYEKASRTHEILGCGYEHFVAHIESQFTEGMCWDKMGRLIHIDHKIPLATATTEQELLALNHYMNLRPLWAIDNLKKGAKLDYPT
jgi:hypothetical protein